MSRKLCTRARTSGSAHLSGAVDSKHAQRAPIPPPPPPPELLLVLMLFGHICAAADARAALPFVFTRPRAGASSDTHAHGEKDSLTMRFSMRFFWERICVR